MQLFGLSGVLLLVALSIGQATAAESTRGDIARGARYYSQNCGRCHNARGPAEHNDRDWSIVVVHMRITAGIPGAQARDIEAFMRASNNPPPPAEPSARATALSGEALIGRYGCRACHALAGSGGRVGPALDGVIERRSVDWVRAQLRNPREHNPQTVMPIFGLSDEQIDAIVETLRAPR